MTEWPSNGTLWTAQLSQCLCVCPPFTSLNPTFLAFSLLTLLLGSSPLCTPYQAEKTVQPFFTQSYASQSVVHSQAAAPLQLLQEPRVLQRAHKKCVLLQSCSHASALSCCQLLTDNTCDELGVPMRNTMNRALALAWPTPSVWPPVSHECDCWPTSLVSLFAH